MPKPIVIVSEPIASEPLDWLAQRVQLVDATRLDRSELLDQLANAHALVVRTYTIVDAELLDRAPSLRVVARAGVGLDNINLDACRSRSVRVVHTPAANTNAVVEYVTQMMLAAIRPITHLEHPVSDADWHTLREQAITPRTCVGAQLGIVGFGKIGSTLARVAAALGMRVVYHDIQEIAEHNRNGSRSVSLEELAATSDVISIHVDSRASNRHFFASSFFNQLRPNAILLNTARGFVIDDHAAATFAQSNPNATLIFDVHNPEPIAVDSPLNTILNVIRTPHIAAATKSAKEQMSWVARDVVRVLAGEDPEFPAF